MRKLISITALYKCDTDEGLRVSMTDDGQMYASTDEFYKVLTENYDELWDDAIAQNKDQKLIDSFRRRLHKRSRRPMPKKPQLTTIAMIIGAVYLMEKHGYIPSNSFNGIKLEWADLS
jgi:hypothetical protein